MHNIKRTRSSSRSSPFLPTTIRKQLRLYNHPKTQCRYYCLEHQFHRNSILCLCSMFSDLPKQAHTLQVLTAIIPCIAPVRIRQLLHRDFNDLARLNRLVGRQVIQFADRNHFIPNIFTWLRYLPGDGPKRIPGGNSARNLLNGVFAEQFVVSNEHTLHYALANADSQNQYT